MRDPLPIEPLSAPPDTTVDLPGSKSLTNRALVTAALASGTTVLERVLFADDTWAMIDALGALGIRVETDEAAGTVTVTGCGGRLPEPDSMVHARQSGTTGRFVTPLAALNHAPVVVDGDPQLRSRPMGDQIDALRELGVTVEELGEPGRLPVRVTGPPTGHEAAVAGDVSSQFVSGLLLAGGVFGLGVRLTAAAVSRPYLDMTVAVMRAFGADVEDVDDVDETGSNDAVGPGSGWNVGGGYVSPGSYRIEPDASAASYFLAAAAITGGRVRVDGLGRDSLQGDVAFADLLDDMGAIVDIGADHVEVRGRLVDGRPALRGIDVDLRHLSDTAPTLAVVAAFADGPTTVRGIGFVRGKESDRVGAPVAELARCGVTAETFDDGFVVRPGADGPTAATFETYDDHRMAMAFALVGLVVEGVAIRGPGCVAKTFPGYFGALEQLR